MAAESGVGRGRHPAWLTGSQEERGILSGSDEAKGPGRNSLSLKLGPTVAYYLPMCQLVPWWEREGLPLLWFRHLLPLSSLSQGSAASGDIWLYSSSHEMPIYSAT